MGPNAYDWSSNKLGLLIGCARMFEPFHCSFRIYLQAHERKHTQWQRPKQNNNKNLPTCIGAILEKLINSRKPFNASYGPEKKNRQEWLNKMHGSRMPNGSYPLFCVSGRKACCVVYVILFVFWAQTIKKKRDQRIELIDTPRGCETEIVSYVIRNEWMGKPAKT